MEHFRDMKHEKEKKLRWKGTVTMDERRDSWDKKEKAGKQCIRNKKRKTVGVEMLEQRVKKGKDSRK